MRKIRELLRLRAAGRSQRQIAASLGMGQSTVGDCLARARLAGVGDPAELDDAALVRALYPPRPAVPAQQRGQPDWAHVHRELRRKSVTLFLLWEEYKADHPLGFQYSWFCLHYRTWAGKLDLVMRQHHRAGEALFVDYAGQTVAVVDRHTGELQQAEIFVAVLGASNYTFAEATWTPSCCRRSMSAPSRSCPARDAASSSNSIALYWAPCLPVPTSSPPGRRRA